MWVEDEETRSYLEAAWNGESQIQLYVAGGHKNTRAVVAAARQDGNTHVFGLRDRDFARSNRARWEEPSVSIFVGELLEIENLMLDPVAIADCDVNTSGRNHGEIEEHLADLAKPQAYWMACRRLISEISEALTQGFIGHPKRGAVVSHEDAARVITGSAWWTSVLPSLEPAWGQAKTVEDKLVSYSGEYQSALADGTWRERFSGKEILRELRSLVWTKKQLSGSEGHQVFAREIARAQLRLGRVPEEVAALRGAILKRIGREGAL